MKYGVLRTVLFLIVLPAPILAAPSANAGQRQDCESSDPDVRIRGCTALYYCRGWENLKSIS